MIISLLTIRPLPDKQQAVIEIRMSVQTITRLKPGCVSCEIYEVDKHGEKILYIEKWQTKEDMHEHVRSKLYLRVLSAMEFSNEPPEISFHEGSETKGIELIEAIRTRSDNNEDA